MTMLRPSGKAEKIAKKVMKSKGIKVPNARSDRRKQLDTPYLQH